MDKIIFSISSNKKVVRKIADALSCPIGKIKVTHFEDGEIMVKSLSDVKDKMVIVVQSTSKPAHEKLFELLLLLDSIKRSGAKKIILFIPYFGYSRQERVSFKNEPVSCEVVARLLDTANVDKIITFDVHHEEIVSFFETPFLNQPTTSLFSEYYQSYFASHHIDLKDVVVVSPDHGSNQRAHLLGEYLGGVDVIILDKYRPKPNQAEHLYSSADVENKVCIIVDDIVDTGGTLISAINLLKEKNARLILVAASHAVLSKKSSKLLKMKQIDDIVVTNSIEKTINSHVSVVDLAPLIIKEIQCDE